jgi:hypothetical protein
VAQNTEISSSKLNLKAQNIHIKLLLKPLYKPWVETACLGENWFCKKWPKWRNFAQSGHTVDESCGLYYKHMMMVNDDSSIVSEQSF